MTKTINIGMIGLGTIGFGVFIILRDNVDSLNEKYGINIKVHSVADLEINNLKDKISKDINQYKDGHKIVEDPEIDIVVELIGGTKIAKDLMVAAIKNKKDVVTANKAIISEFGEEIFELANKNDVNIAYEAAVGGVIPVINTVSDYLSSNKIQSIKGILNGTCNFIITKMEEGLSYEEAIKTAQQNGFAEADPTLDVNGADTAHKITILSRLAFGINVTFNDIYYQGIQNLTKVDFDYAKENGYKIKLLGMAREINGKYEICVGPVLVQKDHLLAKVDNEYNAVYVKGNHSDPILLVGKGAGRYPTATAVVNNIVLLAKKSVFGIKEKYPKLTGVKGKLFDISEKKIKGYLRILSKNVPGVLAKEAKVLGENKINIRECFQRTEYQQGDYIPNIVIIDKNNFSQISSTMKDLEKLDCVGEKPFFMGFDE